MMVMMTMVMMVAMMMLMVALELFRRLESTPRPEPEVQREGRDDEQPAKSNDSALASSWSQFIEELRAYKQNLTRPIGTVRAHSGLSAIRSLWETVGAYSPSCHYNYYHGLCTRPTQPLEH